MSVARILCRAQVGLAAPRVDVEVHLGAGLPCFNIVGLPATEVKESKERVRAALVNSGFEFPAGRITVNLAPADLPKDGGRFDLAIAVGILLASRQLAPRHDLTVLELLGELGLAGNLRSVQGALPAAAAAAAQGHRLVLPTANTPDLRWYPGLAAVVAADLLDVCAWLEGRESASADHHITPEITTHPHANRLQQLRLGDVCGQALGKRALEVAAAGGHSLLLVGPPGCGKSMLAERLPSLLPPLSDTEALEVAMISSLAINAAPRSLERPFRSPHHTASANAIIGGGPNAGPGEVTLAHRGVLFLDELPEFDRRVLEALREPLETGRVAVSRVGAQTEYPAGFQLIAAMNPCPCGYLGSRELSCRCAGAARERYRSRLSGPLLDRLDLRVELDSVSNADLAEHRRARQQGVQAGDAPARDAARETAACAAVVFTEQSLRQRIAGARRRQLQRQACLNAALTGPALATHTRVTAAANAALLAARSQQGTSLRAQDRLIRVAQTIADLRDAATAVIEEQDVIDALAMRRALS
jgi:magnesium chelatase family protein